LGLDAAECDSDGEAALHGLLHGTLGNAFWRQLINMGREEGMKDPSRDQLLLPGITDPVQSARLRSVWKALDVIFRDIEASAASSRRLRRWLERSTGCIWPGT
jgi:hypothetical protein